MNLTSPSFSLRIRLANAHPFFATKAAVLSTMFRISGGGMMIPTDGAAAVCCAVSCAAWHQAGKQEKKRKGRKEGRKEEKKEKKETS